MSSGETLLNVFFYIFALVAIGGAVAVALSQNIVRSAFALLAVLFAAAAFYAFMRADFIFAAQILIYVGGILVLIIFAIMLTHRITDVRISNESTHGPAAFFACLCLLFSLVVVIATYRWNRTADPEQRVIAGDPAKQLKLRMMQGDGTTGISRGGMMLDGRGVLLIEGAHLPAGYGAARVGLRRYDAKEQDHAKRWKAVAPRREGANDAGFEDTPDAGRVAKLEITGLEPGAYRWSVALVPETGSGTPTPAIGFGGLDEGGAADFTVEAGLTRPIALALMGPYLLPFEVISVLLLAALIGAAFLARKEVKP